MKFKVNQKVEVITENHNSVVYKGDLGVILCVSKFSKGYGYKIKIDNKGVFWLLEDDIKGIGCDKVEIIKFNPTGYEYEMNVHHISVLAENLVFMKEDEDFTWANRSTIYIQMNNEAEVTNLNYSFYFQKVDGTKKMFKLKEIMENSNLVDLLIHYLVECEDEYLFNLMKDYNLNTLQEAYDSVEKVIESEYKITSKVKEHELNELMYEIEVFHMSNAIDKALDEGNEELFYKLTGGKK